MEAGATRKGLNTIGTIGAGHEIAPVPRAQVAAKRAVDVGGSLVLVVLSSPVLVALTIAVLVTSGRPFLYRQRRVGRGGREFEILKFRSMRSDADQVLRSVPQLEAAYRARGYKLPSTEDPRVTRLGRFMRRFDLDELPQLINVLRGDMSLVGPRPVPEPELLLYGPARAAYEAVRPGLTGLWQVSGRNELSYRERVALDVRYVEQLSLLLDATILLRTPVVLLRRSAVAREIDLTGHTGPRLGAVDALVDDGAEVVSGLTSERT